MLWIILFFFLIIGLIAVIASAANSGQAMNALALQESIKRNHPDDALGQLGPHEFQRAFLLARQRRNSKIATSLLLWTLLGFFIGTFAMAVFSAADSMGMGILVTLVIVGFFMWYGVRKGRARVPQVLDLMRAEMHL